MAFAMNAAEGNLTQVATLRPTQALCREFCEFTRIFEVNSRKFVEFAAGSFGFASIWQM
jgi:hypothetical protein